jgi:hypothetical protein
MAKKPIVFRTATNDYTARQQIGGGGSGVVYEAVDDVGSVFAVKVLSPEHVSSIKRKRFSNELNFGKANRHPNIVTIIESGVCTVRDTEVPFYVMPRYDRTLRSLITHGIESSAVLSMFGQILDGVEAAHKSGVIHRDLKPENVLQDGGSGTLLVADFGIARFTAEQLLTLVETKPNERLANFEYAAPEQRRKGATVDETADIFALGLLLNEMFTGALAHGTGYDTVSSVAPNYAYVDAIVDRMIRQKPLDRFPSIDAVKLELIARGNEFIARQEFDAAKNAVVREGEVTDPLVLEPPRIVAFDIRGGDLIFTLDKPINRGWVLAFQNPQGVSFYPGHGYKDAKVSGKTIRVRSAEGYEQRLIDQFKTFGDLANRAYAAQVRANRARSIQIQRDQLRIEAEDQERRKDLLGRLRL